jgi:hypothetical protein
VNDQAKSSLDLAIACRAAGRTSEAIAHYRISATAYRDAGQMKNAIAVCQSLLEIAPEDPVGGALLASLGSAERTTGFDRTPIPAPMPYHVADPTMRLRKEKASDPELAASTIPGLLAALDSEESLDTPYDVAGELETRRRDLLASDDIVTPVPSDDGVVMLVRDTDKEMTRPTSPRAAVDVSIDITNPNLPVTSVSQMLLSGALFAGIPAPRRQAVLSRFVKKPVLQGTVVIKRGETDHPLIVVGVGELSARENGRTLYDVVAGEHVGEGALLARQPSPIDVVAVVASELLLLYPHELYEIAGAFPALWARLKDVAEKRARSR